MEDTSKILLGLKRVLSPKVSDSVRLETSGAFVNTNKKTGISLVGVTIASPEIGQWHLRFQIDAKAKTTTGVKVLGAFNKSKKGFEFQKSGIDDNFLNDLISVPDYNKRGWGDL